MKICYNGEAIDLIYSPVFESSEINPKKFLKIKVEGDGYSKIKLDNCSIDEYNMVEEEALMYLIKNAIDNKTCDNNLKEIVSIKQNIICAPVNDHFELEIILTGIAVFERKK